MTEAKMRTASWVIKELGTGKVIMETYDRKKVDALNTTRYQAVPIHEHLVGLNRKLQKSTPMVSKPNDFCVFNGEPRSPYPITREQAATGLRSIRQASRQGNGRIKRQGPGQYTLTTFETLVLTIRK